MRRMLLVGLLALVVAAPAGALTGNLDADPANERVVVVDPPPASTLGRKVVLKDRCGTTMRTFSLSRVFDKHKYLRFEDVDGNDDRPEIIFELRSSNGHRGTTKVVRLGHPDQGGCVRPVTLFSYNAANPPIAPPSGLKVTNWRLSFGNYSTSRPGQEMRLWEGYVRRGASMCCPTLQRVSDYAYASGTDDFFSYRSQVSAVG